MRIDETSILTHMYSSNQTVQKTASASMVFCSKHPLYLGLQATLFTNQSLNLPANLPTLKIPFNSYILDILIIQFLTQAFIPFSLLRFTLSFFFLIMFSALVPFSFIIVLINIINNRSSSIISSNTASILF